MLITDQHELNTIINRTKTERVFMHVIPEFLHDHPCLNSVSSYHFLFNDGTYRCYAPNHPDSTFNLGSFPLETAHKILVVDKKYIMTLLSVGGSSLTDISVLHSLRGTELPSIDEYISPMAKRLNTMFRHRNLNAAIPLVKWMGTVHKYLLALKNIHDGYSGDEVGGFSFINDVTIPTLATIEASGIYTTDHVILHSQYNIHTSTGRPSNAFGGINFAALNKSDGTRDKFISRFGENGTLVQFDYEAFHLRLAADRIGFKLPETPSLHRLLAEQYYGTTEVTQDRYEESKARTFAIMYGQTDDVGEVPFFKELKRLIPVFWDKYRANGHLLSTTGRKLVVPDPNPAKVFNYLMQLTETEVAMTRVHTVCNYLRRFKSRVVLYTYDAILLDVPNEELSLMESVSNLLSDGGFPVRQYRGNTYGNLTVYTD